MTVKKYLSILILTILVIGCNEVSNKIITDTKTGKPMLIGETEKNDFESPDFADWYNAEYTDYEPDEFIIEEIKSNINDVSIQIFMGTWCSDSRREVPSFLKILENQPIKLIVCCHN